MSKPFGRTSELFKERCIFLASKYFSTPFVRMSSSMCSTNDFSECARKKKSPARAGSFSVLGR